MLIGAEWISEGTGGRYDHVNPATGKVQRSIALAGPSEIDRAVAAARTAFPKWKALPSNQRRDIMLRIAELLRRDTDELAGIATLENGAPSTFTPILAGELPAEYFTYYGGWVDKLCGEAIPVYPMQALDYTIPEPYGVVAVIIPWNGPLTSIGQKVAAALAAGNCVVLKPSELAPFTSLRFAELCLEAGLPPGVLNVVPGGPKGGEALVSHPGVDKISFTGGGATATKVLQGAAKSLTPVILELGGKSANLVFEDADLDKAVAMAVQTSVATLSGQGCVLPTRLIVQDSVYDEVIEQVVDLTESLTVGDPWDPATVVGPVVSAHHCSRIEGVIARARQEGAGELLTGGERVGGELSGGYYLQPTIFGDVDNRSHLAQEEIFGPVLSVLRFRNEDEAVSLANDTKYGLGAFVHTTNLTTAHNVVRRLDAGYIGVNGFALMPPNAPFGGVKQSGYGREGGSDGIREFVQSKNVYIDLES
ncbi:aldehyde dehydrogenase family protein [Mycobacterium sp. CVI_P3]|uniref:Putative succinate-semialdehyde dehydrogenase [NADP(+)] 2 n=2 Tax=Mycobacterium pinniadriaticum TaxID=2994102 RepID=A0ABT3SNU5_9MYCO|nr:aldehyde dehydrogenase family protein [Mycobacterium pinniadriaticum]MCX2940843.1 aldehyde dehydrogenase family protein [Mycobacterium pinniadriaticum]